MIEDDTVLPGPGGGAEPAPDPEMAAIRLRAGTACVIALACIVLSLHWIPMMGGVVGRTAGNLILLVLSGVAQFWCGLDFYRGMIAAARRGTADMNTLIALGSTSAYVASVTTLLKPDWLVPPGAEGHLYFVTSALIVAYILVGRFLEVRARLAGRDAVRALAELRPRTARRKAPFGEELVPLARLAAGDRVLIGDGGRVPADGVIESGQAAIDESMLTGEDLPAERKKGQPVFEGSLVISGSLVVEVCLIGEQTMLSQVIDLVAKAQTGRAPASTLVDRVTRLFVPAILFLALAVFAIWFFWGGEQGTVMAVSNFVAVLIAACPGALGLATPLAVMYGTNLGAQEGVLVRDAACLEVVPRIDTVVFDKAGTLTVGIPAVHHVAPTAGVEPSELMQAAIDAEQGRDHPVSRALVDRSFLMGLNPGPLPVQVQVLARGGILARWEDDEVRVGRREVFDGTAIAGVPSAEEIEGYLSEGLNPILVARRGRFLGVFGLADIVRLGAAEAVAALRAEGIRTVLLTSDHPLVAQALGRIVGIDEVVSEVDPVGKEQKIADLQRAGHVVAMVGDGINDAPALARADLGIAVGPATEFGTVVRSRTDIAIASAGITLIRGNPHGVLTALRLGRVVMRTIRRNLFFALIYNVLMVPLAAGVFVPWGLSLHPMAASIATVLGSVTVVQNSMRLKRAMI